MKFSDAARTLDLAFRLVAFLTQGLLIGLVVRATFSQRNDVITFGGRHSAVVRQALNAQRLAREQRSPHRLKAPASDTLDWCRANPRLTRMISTSTAAITDQLAAAFEGARSGSTNWHRF